MLGVLVRVGDDEGGSLLRYEEWYCSVVGDVAQKCNTP